MHQLKKKNVEQRGFSNDYLLEYYSVGSRAEHFVLNLAKCM